MTAILAHRVTLGRRATNFVSRLPNSGMLLFLGGMALGLTLGSAQINNLSGADSPPGWWAGWLSNISTEMFGAFLTFILLELIVQTRERRGLLLREMRSSDNATARNAVEELRAEGWLFDGTLRGANLSRANLQGADLFEADLEGASLGLASLEGANLQRAVLSGASLQGAKLQGAALYGARVQGANLTGADLEGGKLGGANLQGADLRLANLQEADLEEANLQGASGLTVEKLQQARRLRGVTLPDGIRLPHEDIWREVFEEWCQKVPRDEQGYIEVAAVEDERAGDEG